MGRTIADVLAAYEPPTRTVTICLQPALVTEYEQAVAVLAAAQRGDDTIAGGDPTGELAERVETLKAAIADASVPFLVKALSQSGWSDLIAAHPDTNPDESARLAFDIEALLTASIAECTIDPTMTVDEAQQLRATLSKPEVERLSNTIWELNNTGADIPFDVAAYESRRSPDAK